MKIPFLPRLQPLLVVWPLLIFAVCGNAYAGSEPKIKRGPSNEVTGESKKVTAFFGCYGSGVGFDGPIPCTFEYRVKGLAPPANSVVPCDPANPNGERTCVTGGHSHNGTRPFVFNPPGKVEFDADELPFDDLAVKGNTLATPPLTLAKVTHKLPQVGGVLQIEGFLKLPPPTGIVEYFCTSPRCDDDKTINFKGTVDVRVRDLTQLPGAPGQVTADHYVKGRNPDADHLDIVAFSASPFTRAALPQLSKQLFKASGRTLSVNDISLPKGGVFDLSRDWDARGRGDGHREHRDGNDADINTQNTKCQEDPALRAAVDRVLVGILRIDENGKVIIDPVTKKPHPFSALLCEEEGFKHIDFTQFFVPRSLKLK